LMWGCCGLFFKWMYEAKGLPLSGIQKTGFFQSGNTLNIKKILKIHGERGILSVVYDTSLLRCLRFRVLF